MSIYDYLDTKEREEILFEKPDYTLQDENVYEVSSQEEAKQFAEKFYSENQHAFEKFGMTREGLESLGIMIDNTSEYCRKLDNAYEDKITHPEHEVWYYCPIGKNIKTISAREGYTLEEEWLLARLELVTWGNLLK